MTTFTRLDATLSELVDLCTTVLGAQDVQVLDGPYVGELEDDVLLLGLPDGDRPGYRAVIGRQQGMGRPRVQEDWTVHCMLSLTTGTNDVAGLRTRAAMLLGLLDDGLRDRVAVEDVWNRAGVDGELEWIPMLAEQGASVTVFFDVGGAVLL